MTNSNRNHYALHPIYDSAKSFYGKAYWRDAEGDRVLYSYGTEVARITASGVVEIENLYSVTTTRHIREFLLQNGFPAGSARQIRTRYIERGGNENGD